METTRQDGNILATNSERERERERSTDREDR